MEITYQLTKKQDFFQKNIGTFVKQKITPRVKEIDRAEEFPPEVMADLAGNRLLGLLVPKEEGGEGAGFLDLCLALEGIGRICPTSALVCSVQNLGAWLLSKSGTQAQKEKHLSDMMAGGTIFGYALPDVLSLDPLKVSLSASKDNEGFILNGPECFVINGDVSEVICLFAKDEDSVHGFLVGKDAQGLKAARSIGTAGAEARIMCMVVLENCRVPKDSLMGAGGDGKEIMAHMVNAASCFTAARALGLSQGALDFAIDYSKKREQFGVAIRKFPAVQIMLADMSARVEASRQLVYKTAAVLDQNGKESNRFSSMARHFVSRMAVKVTSDAIQVGGGYAYTKDYPCEKMMRNALLCQVLDGGNHTHQLASVRSI